MITLKIVKTKFPDVRGFTDDEEIINLVDKMQYSGKFILPVDMDSDDFLEFLLDGDANNKTVYYNYKTYEGEVYDEYPFSVSVHPPNEVAKEINKLIVNAENQLKRRKKE